MPPPFGNASNGNSSTPLNPFYGQAPRPYPNETLPPYTGYAQPPYPYVEQKSKIAAGLFAILFPYLGIHGFYLGNSALGLTVLLISIGCAGFTLITFGIGALLAVPVLGLIHIMSLIQGILYLATPDAEFHQKYVIEKRWF